MAKYFKFELDGATLVEAFKDRSEVCIIQGPFGSGTSTMCCHKLWAIAKQQKPDQRGVRKSRHLIVRNTFAELKETTLKTWSYWFEEVAQGQFGQLLHSNPPNHHIKFSLPDGTTVSAEFIFISLDDPSDVRKLLSWEFTTVWFNECQFTEKEIFDAAHGRVMQGRYPPLLDGGPTFKGVLGDMNAPSEGHWIPYMRGDVPMPDEWDEEQRREYTKPEGWKFLIQPAGLIEIFENGKLVGYKENPEAENQKWIQESYLSMIKGKPKGWIDSYVMNRVGLYRAGRPVFEDFVPEMHVAKQKLEFNPDWPLIVGLDFARNPAAIFMQSIRGVIYVLSELGAENTNAGVFAPLVKKHIQREYPEAFAKGVQFWGDPTGASAGQATDRTPYQIFHSNGMNVVAAPGNNSIPLRLEAVGSLLSKMVNGGPGLLVNASARIFKAGMAGGYHFAKIKGSGGRHHDTPYKDRFSDYCDAFQYGCLGAGVGFAALNPSGNKPNPAKRERKRYSLRNRR